MWRNVGCKPAILEGPRNVTVLSGSSVLFRCAVDGDPEPAVSWQKNGRSLHYAGHANYRVLESGDLKLDNVGLADDGLYHCIARNVKGMDYSAQARLHVEEPAKLKGGRSIYNVSWGSNVRLECSAQGEPPPVITWFQDGEPLDDAYALADPVFTHSELFLNATRTTSFTCKATNSLISLNSSLVTDSKQFQLYVTPKDEDEDEEEEWDDNLPFDVPGSEEDDVKEGEEEEDPLLLNELEEEEEEEKWEEKKEEVSGSGAEKPREESGPFGGGGEVTVGYCAPYTGQICRRYLNGSGHVYYNFTSENHPIPLNEQITTELWSELISSLLEPCRHDMLFLLVTQFLTPEGEYYFDINSIEDKNTFFLSCTFMRKIKEVPSRRSGSWFSIVSGLGLMERRVLGYFGPSADTIFFIRK
ncbi:muscle, skeletal receptor tyrosine-protein kinase [Caerostris extrusa]|uniref:Muscle, skeletal receptor tyrosine-protein kinase n=1 Tax=Caerostris extrusa TaxID=172846 RepID=A0AAV4S7X8_CAEEX|nr:muscle, skeletal receptor tyrosine-protein kinase [Caerostris extrusa]